MLLQHAKLLAFNHGGKAIKDCVITVPSSFTQHEKSAVFTAASIADLNILTLIEENTAAALQYGIDRIHETPTNVLYYNMGAEGIQVSLHDESKASTLTIPRYCPGHCRYVLIIRRKREWQKQDYWSL